MEKAREWSIESREGNMKKIRLIQGDLTELQGPCDIVVFSAVRQFYRRFPNTLIDSLYKKGYDIKALAARKDPALTFADGWISGKTGMDYRRIACLELLDRNDEDAYSGQKTDIVLKKSFSTLSYMLEQASLSGIPVKTLAMTIPGVGEQRIDLCYILIPLIVHCLRLLKEDIVDEISIYERVPEVAEETEQAFDLVFGEHQQAPDVFISYSSRQQGLAYEICRSMRDSGIECWMAPESIPEGTSYQEMIPDAISSAKILLLILTPDAEKSRWVQKEVGSAIGANKVILPYQVTAFNLGKQFMFLLDGEQIMYDEKVAGAENHYRQLVSRVREILAETKKDDPRAKNGDRRTGGSGSAEDPSSKGREGDMPVRRKEPGSYDTHIDPRHLFEPYDGDEKYIFVSYNHQDSDRVYEIITAFYNRGYRIWHDRGIRAGESFVAVLAKKVKECGVFFCFLSPGYFTSKYHKRELNFALENDRIIFPIMLKDFELPDEFKFQLSTTYWASYSGFASTEEFVDQMTKLSAEFLDPCKAKEDEWMPMEPWITEPENEDVGTAETETPEPRKNPAATRTELEAELKKAALRDRLRKMFGRR